MADEKLTVEMEVTGRSEKTLQNIEKGLVDLQKEAKKLPNIFRGAFSVFTGNVLTQGFNALTSAARSTFNFIVTEGVAAASRQEDAINKLNIALKSSGQFSEEASKGFQEFASALQATTTVGDETILEIGALIQSLGQLDQKGLQQATTAALDLSAALGIDLNAAALLVGKAAAGEVSTFSRYGLIIRKGADSAQTFANALEAINQKFGGAAAQQVNTFSGAFEQLTNIIGDLQEQFGFAITGNSVIIAVIKELSQVFNEFGAAVGDSRTGLQDFVASGVLIAIDSLGVFISVLQAVDRVAKVVFASLKSGVDAAVSGFTALTQAASGNFAEAFETLKASASDSGKRIDEALNKESGLDQFSDSLARVKGAAEQAFGAAQQEASAAALAQEQAAIAAQLRAQKEAEAEAARQERLFKEIQEAQTRAELFRTIDEEENAAEIARLETQIAEKQALLQQDSTNALKLKAAQVKREKELDKQRQANFKSSLSTIGTLQQNASGELFRVGQAANIATATIDGISAVQKALAAAPPPFNFALAALVGTATAANIAKIASAKPPSFQDGITEVPGGFAADNFPAFLQSGERVVDANANSDLKNFLAQQQAGGGVENLRADILALASRPVQVMIDGATVFEAVNEQLESGREFA